LVKRMLMKTWRICKCGSYSEVVALAEKVGINPGIFDSEFPVAQSLNRAVDDDERVRRLVAERGA
jgi:hypothetical protein